MFNQDHKIFLGRAECSKFTGRKTGSGFYDSGRLDAEHIAELGTLIAAVTKVRRINLDLKQYDFDSEKKGKDTHVSK